MSHGQPAEPTSHALPFHKSVDTGRQNNHIAW
jgi:hypothetical protein